MPGLRSVLTPEGKPVESVNSKIHPVTLSASMNHHQLTRCLSLADRNIGKLIACEAYLRIRHEGGDAVHLAPLPEGDVFIRS